MQDSVDSVTLGLQNSRYIITILSWKRFKLFLNSLIKNKIHLGGINESSCYELKGARPQMFNSDSVIFN